MMWKNLIFKFFNFNDFNYFKIIYDFLLISFYYFSNNTYPSLIKLLLLNNSNNYESFIFISNIYFSIYLLFFFIVYYIYCSYDIKLWFCGFQLSKYHLLHIFLWISQYIIYSLLCLGHIYWIIKWKILII